MVYFIQSGKTGPIKIGYSKDKESVLSRLASLQTSSPDKLYLLGVVEGSGSSETTLHHKYRAFKAMGEWFYPEPSLIKYINMACGRGDIHHVFSMDTLKTASLDKILSDVENAYVTAAIKECGGNKSEAARLLGVSFRSLRYRLDKIGNTNN